MKKLISLLICICMLFSSFPSFAEDIYIELDALKYDAYMRGETITIYGSSNTYVYFNLYYPEEYGGTSKFSLVYSPDELANGIDIETDAEDPLWLEGTWTITVQSGEVSSSLEFYLTDFVDRTEEETEPPTSKPSTGNNNNNTGGGNVPSVVTIIPEKNNLTLTAGESEKIDITTSAKSLSLEIEDEDVISASISGKTLTVTALKRGTSAIWVKASNNYANINVTVKAKSINDDTSHTEEPTEEATEAPMEDITEEPTEVPTEKESENPFVDLPDNHWAKASVLTLYNKGVINGMSEDTFAPDEYVTRAQFVTMLYKAFNLTYKESTSPFTDVTAADWFFPSVMASYENGISKGNGLGSFNPHSLVTRQDMATFAHRAALKKGIVFNVKELLLFSDHASISDYAVEAVYSMRSEGIINGMTEYSFEPLGNATRAQAAHIIAKLLELK